MQQPIPLYCFFFFFFSLDYCYIAISVEKILGHILVNYFRKKFYRKKNKKQPFFYSFFNFHKKLSKMKLNANIYNNYTKLPKGREMRK